MNRSRAAGSILCLVPAVVLTGCPNPQHDKQSGNAQTILVAPHSIGPLWHAGDVLTWQKQPGSPDFTVYVLPRTCTESVPGGAAGPSGTEALPQSQSPTCTLLPQQQETPFVYYIGFKSIGAGGPTSPPPPPDLEGPFAARVGICRGCPPTP